LGPKDLAPDFVKPYKVNDKMVNQSLELKHGKSVRVFPMDKVSNGCFTPVCHLFTGILSNDIKVSSQKEFERWKATLAHEEVKLPTKRDLEQKVVQLHKLPTQPVTEVRSHNFPSVIFSLTSDITRVISMLCLRANLNSTPGSLLEWLLLSVQG
jgi:hypothetical protein